MRTCGGKSGQERHLPGSGAARRARKVAACGAFACASAGKQGRPGRIEGFRGKTQAAMEMTIRKLFIANRSEIACRIAQTAHKMGIPTAGVYAPPDAHSRHIRVLGEVVKLPAGDLSRNYLNAKLLIDTAKRLGADAIHP